jgi:hypothetical protein
LFPSLLSSNTPSHPLSQTAPLARSPTIFPTSSLSSSSPPSSDAPAPAVSRPRPSPVPRAFDNPFQTGQRGAPSRGERVSHTRLLTYCRLASHANSEPSYVLTADPRHYPSQPCTRRYSG